MKPTTAGMGQPPGAARSDPFTGGRHPEPAPAASVSTVRGADEGPRERLASLGPEALADSELLAILLRTGRRGTDAQGLAARLLDRTGGLAGLRQISLSALCSVAGVGPAKAAAVLAALEVGRRLASVRLQRGDPIRGPDDVYRHFYQRMRSLRREHFVVLLLDGRHRVMGECQVSQGTLTASLVHPREVFQAAVGAAAAAVVLVHNHPSGDPTPSVEDHEVTRRLADAGEILGIRILDHVVVAEHGYHSFEEHGDLPRPGAARSSSGGRQPGPRPVSGAPGPAGSR